MRELNIYRLATKMCHFLCKEYQICTPLRPPVIKALKGTVIGMERQINPRIAEKYQVPHKTVVGLYISDENTIIVLSPAKGFNYSFEQRKYIEDKKIGAVYSPDPNVRMITDLAHEIAHWFRFQTKGSLIHDKQWRECYGILRDKFVNQRRGVLVGKAAINKGNHNKNK